MDRMTPLSDESPIKIFLSSVMAGKSELRRLAREAIESLPIAKTWTFEAAPASPLQLEESYLRHVRNCDMFVLIIDDDVTEPVERELDEAISTGRPILAFVGTGELSEAAKALVGRLTTRYKEYSDLDDLGREITASVASEVVRRFRLSPDETIAAIAVSDIPKAQSSDPVYCIMGVDRMPLIDKIILLFGGQELADRESLPGEGLAALALTSMAELQVVAQALGRINSAAAAVPDAQYNEAFVAALSSELAGIYSEYFVKEMNLGGDSDSKPNGSNPDGLRYVLMVSTPERIMIARLLFPRLTLGPNTAFVRDAEQEFALEGESASALSEGMAKVVFDKGAESFMSSLLSAAIQYQVSKAFRGLGSSNL